MKCINIVFWLLLIIAVTMFCSGCNTPAQTMNFFTPDRLGYGIMDGTMKWNGHGEMTTIWNSDVGDIYWDVEGESQSTLLYLEWDLPSWNDDTATDKYVRDRVRALNMALEAAAKKVDD